MAHMEAEMSIYVLYGEFDLCSLRVTKLITSGFIDHSELFWKRASESIVLMEYKVCALMKTVLLWATAILHIPHSDEISRGDTSDIKTSILLTYQGQITLEATMQWLKCNHQPESDW